MIPIKLDKRVAEETSSIRNRVQKSKTMTPGEKNAILNRLSAIESWARKSNAQLQRGHYRRAMYDARTQDDIAAQARAKKAVFLALMAGRRVDLTMAEQFQLSQMHTAIAQIRKDIDRKHPDLQLCDEWVRPAEGVRPYKQYWIVKKEDKA